MPKLFQILTDRENELFFQGLEWIQKTKTLAELGLAMDIQKNAFDKLKKVQF